MKHIKYMLLILFIIPFNVFAYTFTCPEGPFKYGDTFTCTIGGNKGQNYDLISGSLDTIKSNNLSCKFGGYASGLEPKDVPKKNGFSYMGQTSEDILFTYNCEVTAKLDANSQEQLIISDFKYHVFDDNRDASTEILRSNYVILQQYVEQVAEQVDTRSRKTDNPDSRLKLISDENLDFTFSAFKTEYDLSVLFEVEQLNLYIVTNNENAKYRIEGSQTLEIGPNVIDIYVTSPDGSSETCYTLNINRLKRGERIYYPEKDSSLSSLSIDGYDIAFEPVILDYRIHVGYKVDFLNINAVANNANAKIDISNTDNIKNGDTITVTVTSQDKSSTTVYMINITKDPKPKDYRPYIYGGLIVVAIIIVIVIILISNQKNKNDPLLRLKGDKKKVNFGKKLDMNNIPDAGAGVQTDGNINTIDLSSSTVQSIESDEVLDTNINQTTSMVNTIDLSNASAPIQQVTPNTATQEVVEVPQQVTPVAPVEPVAQPVTPVVEEVLQPKIEEQVQPVVEQVQQQEIQTLDLSHNVIQPTAVQPEQPKETNIFDQ